MNVRDSIIDNVQDFNKRNNIKLGLSILLFVSGFLAMLTPFYFMPRISVESNLKMVYALSLIGLYIVGVILIVSGIVVFIVRSITKKAQLKQAYMNMLVDYNFENSRYENSGTRIRRRVVDMTYDFSSIINVSFGMDTYGDDYIKGEYNYQTFKSLTVLSSLNKTSGLCGIVVEIPYAKSFDFKHNIEERNEKLEDVILDKVVDVESIEFNKMFSVETEDTHELFYLLTPDVIEKMLKFNKNYKMKVNYIFDESY